MNNEIIDWDAKGNVVRFYLGKNGKQHGDDWNDRPYECNAGTVYPEFIENSRDIAFPFDDVLIFAADGYFNSPYCKDDFKNRTVPFLIIRTTGLADEDWWMTDFDTWKNKNFKGCKCFYFGDILE